MEFQYVPNREKSLYHSRNPVRDASGSKLRHEHDLSEACSNQEEAQNSQPRNWRSLLALWLYGSDRTLPSAKPCLLESSRSRFVAAPAKRRDTPSSQDPKEMLNPKHADHGPSPLECELGLVQLLPDSHTAPAAAPTSVATFHAYEQGEPRRSDGNVHPIPSSACSAPA